MNIPRLTLIGAGPGDIELITIKGIRAIKSADVILFDALANVELLEYARPDALRIYVGKRLGKYVYTQNEINEKIVYLAKEYGHVVRLKGGDPFVFGRGFEEIEYAKSFNVACEIVSGVTSAIAAPACVGIPVTSRGFAESFWVITGTTKKGELSRDIELAAQSTATIVILMGMSKLSEICEVFIKHGKSEMPMAIIQNGTRKNVKSVVGTVSTIIKKSVLKNITNPAVIVIGEVVSLSEQFNEQFSEQLIKNN